MHAGHLLLIYQLLLTRPLHRTVINHYTRLTNLQAIISPPSPTLSHQSLYKVNKPADFNLTPLLPYIKSSIIIQYDKMKGNTTADLSIFYKHTSTSVQKLCNSHQFQNITSVDVILTIPLSM
jgi:hypothetical protein